MSTSTDSVLVDFGVWNAGRSHGIPQAKAQELFDINCKKVHTAVQHGFLMQQEFDEDDLAHEHLSAAHIFGHTHKWVEFKEHTPVAVPDQFRIAKTPRPRTLKMCDGITKFSPHRVMTKGRVVLRDDSRFEFNIGSTHIMRHRKGEADARRAEHIKKLRDQFKLAAKNGQAFVLGLDGNDADLPELHPDQKILYHNRIDYIIALDGTHVSFEKQKTRVVKTNIDNHDLGIVTAKLTWS